MPNGNKKYYFNFIRDTEFELGICRPTHVSNSSARSTGDTIYYVCGIRMKCLSTLIKNVKHIIAQRYQ